jgi:hypothetical protein
MGANQRFIRSRDLKADLARLNEHYSNHPEVNLQGLMRVAQFPPLTGGFMVNDLYDELRPGWREQAAKPPPAMSPEAHKELLERMKVIQSAPGLEPPTQAGFDIHSVDSVIIQRRVPLRRGNYQFLPPQVQPDEE